MQKKIMIYGATGYTGKLLAKHLIKNNINPILAGRSSKVIQVGKQLGCQTKVFETNQVQRSIEDVDVLINVASPFLLTQDGLIKACLRSNTHYIDVSGELADMQHVYRYNSEAQKANIVLLPASGIFSAPMDIVAKIASTKIAKPTHLTITQTSKGKPSRGSFVTALKKIQHSGYVLKNGMYERALPAQNESTEEIFGKKFNITSNPWRADLFTAQLSTGIKNIETYAVYPTFLVKMMKGKMKWLKKFMLKYMVKLLPEGPNAKQLKSGKIYAKATVKNAKGESSSVELIGPDGYYFTIASIEKRIREIVKPININGFVTPSMFGTDWIKEIANIKIN